MVWSVLSGGSSKSLTRSSSKAPTPEDRLAGVGIVFIKAPDNSLFVKNLVEGSGAYSSGIQPGDCLMEVDGKNVYCKGIEYATDLILGVEGSVVRLKLVRIEEKKKKRVPVIANLVREMKATMEPQFNINHEQNRYASGISTKKVFLECLQDDAMSPDKVARSHSALDVSAGKDLPSHLSPRHPSPQGHSDDFSMSLQSTRSNRRPSDDGAGIGAGNLRQWGTESQGAREGPVANSMGDKKSGESDAEDSGSDRDEPNGAEGQRAETMDTEGNGDQGDENASGADGSKEPTDSEPEGAKNPKSKPKKVRRVKYKGKWYTEEQIADMERVAKGLKDGIKELETSGPDPQPTDSAAPGVQAAEADSSASSESLAMSDNTPSPPNPKPAPPVKSHSFAIGQTKASSRAKSYDPTKPQTPTAQAKADDRLTSDPKALGAAIKVVQGGTVQIMKSSALSGRKTIPLKVSTGGSLQYGNNGKQGHVMWARSVTDIYNPKMSKREFGDLNKKFLVMLEGEKVTAHSALGGEVRATEGKEPLEFIAHSEGEREEWVLGINMVLTMARKEATERELKQREKLLVQQARAVQKVNSVFVTEPVHMRKEAEQARENNVSRLRAVSMPPGGAHSVMASNAAANNPSGVEDDEPDTPKMPEKVWGGKLSSNLPAARQSFDASKRPNLPSLISPRTSATQGGKSAGTSTARAERAEQWRQNQEAQAVEALKAAAANWRGEGQAQKEESPTDDLLSAFKAEALSPRPESSPPTTTLNHALAPLAPLAPSAPLALDTLGLMPPTIPETSEVESPDKPLDSQPLGLFTPTPSDLNAGSQDPVTSLAPLVSPPPAPADSEDAACQPLSTPGEASTLDIKPLHPSAAQPLDPSAAQPLATKKGDLSPPGSDGSNDELPSLLSAVSTTGVTPRDTDLKLPEDGDEVKDLKEAKEPTEIKEVKDAKELGSQAPEDKIKEGVSIKLTLSSKSKVPEDSNNSKEEDKPPPTPVKPKIGPSGAKPRKGGSPPKPAHDGAEPAGGASGWKNNLKTPTPQPAATPPSEAEGFKGVGLKKTNFVKESSPAGSTKSNDSVDESPSGKGTAMVRSMIKSVKAKAADHKDSGFGSEASAPRKAEIKGKEKAADLASIMAARRKKQQEAEEDDAGFYF